MSRSSTVASSKQAERDVARVFDGRRLHSGEWCGEGDIDVITPTQAIQVKHWKNVAAYIIEGIRQAQEGAADVEEIVRLLGGGQHSRDVVTFGVAPVLVIVTKPGSGRPSRMFQVTEVFDNGPTDL